MFYVLKRISDNRIITYFLAEDDVFHACDLENAAVPASHIAARFRVAFGATNLGPFYHGVRTGD